MKFTEILSTLNINLWIALLLASLLAEADIIGYYADMEPSVWNVIGLITLAFFKATVLTIAFGLVKRISWLKWGVGIFISLYFLLSAVNGISWILYEFGISRRLITLALETNKRELLEFTTVFYVKIWDYLKSPILWAAILTVIAAWDLILVVPRKIWWRISLICSIFGFFYLIYFVSTASWGKANMSVFARTLHCAMDVRHNMQVIAEMKNVPRILPAASDCQSQHLAENVVVVIGESASRDHHSLYGYPLPTTPALDSLRSGLFVFDDAVASSIATAANMPRLLTFQTDEPDSGEWYEYPSIMQVMNISGYRTHWFSNQERTGELSDLSGILSADADDVRYIGAFDSHDHLSNKYDDALLPIYKETFNEPDTLKLIFLHLMGSHFQYDKRYPADRNAISSKDVRRSIPRPWLNDEKGQTVANYDNSIRFTDSIVGVMIRQLQESPAPSVLIYLSDHGENVYDDRDYTGRDKKYVRVPFIIFANDAYLKKNPGVAKEIERSLHNPFSTSELPQIIMHLTGTRYTSYIAKRDPLSGEFVPRTRYADDVAFKP